MPTDIERPQWLAAKTCAVTGIGDPVALRMWRKHEGLRLGKLDTAGNRRYSALDVAELVAINALRALGLTIAAAVALAHRELRSSLRDVLNNRLFHGFWSVGAIVFDGDTSFARTLYIDQICERVISELALPLPVDPMPHNAEVAARMVDAIFDYIESPPGRLRWSRWHATAIARGGGVPLDHAAAELGAPPWFLRALLVALAKPDDRDPIVVAVRPNAPKAAPHLEGVTLQ